MNSIGTETIDSFFEAVGAGIAIFRADQGGTALLSFANKRFLQMYAIEQLPPYHTPMSAFIPQPHHQIYQACVLQCLQEKQAIEFTHMMNGREPNCWWGVVMAPVFDENNAVDHIIVTSIDVTKDVRLEQRIKQSNARLSAIINSAHDGIIAIDDQQLIKTFNKAAEDIFGYHAKEMIGQSIEMLIPEQARNMHSQYVRDFAASPVESRPMHKRAEVTGLCKDGSVRQLEITIAKIAVHGEHEFMAVVRDVSEQMKYIDELKMYATTDHMTGCSNRRHFIENAEREISRCRRHQYPLSVILLDIDHFKQINDNYGHNAGDTVLTTFAKECLQFKRKSDLVARWGGEEFCFLLPDTDLTHAMLVAERIQASSRKLSFSLEDGQTLKAITASFGVAQISTEDLSIDDLVRKADIALYKAKQNGRDRIETWENED